jgi:hypothetical protein
MRVEMSLQIIERPERGQESDMRGGGNNNTEKKKFISPGNVSTNRK